MVIHPSAGAAVPADPPTRARTHTNTPKFWSNLANWTPCAHPVSRPFHKSVVPYRFPSSRSTLCVDLFYFPRFSPFFCRRRCRASRVTHRVLGGGGLTPQRERRGAGGGGADPPARAPPPAPRARARSPVRSVGCGAFGVARGPGAPEARGSRVPADVGPRLAARTSVTTSVLYGTPSQ